MLHQIGIGTLGPVFRTYEPTRDRLVAVKAFRLDIVPEQAHALAAGLSRATQASLVHPSIVEPLDAGVEGTVAFRAEEYVAAESLDVAMRHYAPAPIEKVLPFITQLAGAIDFARTAGVGHGGLHPRDIFVTPDEARATGFGVVDALEQVGIRAPIRRPYSAPERIDGRAWSTPADVFSLAAITFELLTGKRPSGTGAQIGALPDGKYAAALQSVLARAMDDDPSKRHASALAFAGALDAAAHGRPITEVVTVPAPVVAESKVPAPVRDLVKPEIPKVDIPKAEIPKPEIPKPEIPKPAPAKVELPSVDIPPVETPKAATPEPSKSVDVPIVAAAPTPGEFDIEAALDSPTEASDDVAERPVRAAVAAVPLTGRRSAKREGSLFDLDEEKTGRQEGGKYEDGELEDVGKFDDVGQFDDSGLEGSASPAEAAMFHAAEREAGYADAGDRGRPAILPFAVVGILGLLIGFGGGYFVRSRDGGPPTGAPNQETRDTPDTPKSPAAPAATGAAAGRATPEKAGQYSEQKVAPRATAPAASDPRSAAPSAAAAKGQIIVRSVPSHAGVTVNGMWRGRTPLTIDDVKFGSYVVRVVQAGYKVARDEFTLSAREPSRTFTARLESAGKAAPAPTAPSAFTGSLYVDSRPRGATVTIDGKSAGQTPLTMSDVAVGSHVVRIEMTGKKPVTATPRVVAGQIERVTVSLEDKQDAPAAASEGRR